MGSSSHLDSIGSCADLVQKDFFEPITAMIFEIGFGFVLGTGIGAYNGHHLKECFDDTFHLGKQQAGPLAQAGTEHARRLGNQAHATAMPYVKQLSDKASSTAKQVQENMRTSQK